jgi:hypothetical protein
MSNVTAAADMTQVAQSDLARYVALFFQDVISTVNGHLDFKTNLNCKLINVVFGVANVNVSTPHGLGRPPSGYIVTGASAATSVYNGNMSNTATNINLMASAPATVGLIVF